MEMRFDWIYVIDIQVNRAVGNMCECVCEQTLSVFIVSI